GAKKRGRDELALLGLRRERMVDVCVNGISGQSRALSGNIVVVPYGHRRRPCCTGSGSRFSSRSSSLSSFHMLQHPIVAASTLMAATTTEPTGATTAIADSLRGSLLPRGGRCGGPEYA